MDVDMATLIILPPAMVNGYYGKRSADPAPEPYNVYSSGGYHGVANAGYGYYPSYASRFNYKGPFGKREAEAKPEAYGVYSYSKPHWRCTYGYGGQGNSRGYYWCG